MTKPNVKPPLLCTPLFFLLYFLNSSSSQKTCPNCGSMQVPYPLSTNPSCGDRDYSIRCDPLSLKLYFDALNGSSYLILNIFPSSQRMVVQPSPWLPGTCVTQDMPVSEGLWLNQSLPFNIHLLQHHLPLQLLTTSYDLPTKLHVIKSLPPVPGKLRTC